MNSLVKAMVLRRPEPAENNPLKLEDISVPEVGRGEVLVEVKCCGVCRTDLHIVEGELAPQKLPIVPGHQVIGVVREVGESVGDNLRGKRVGLPWLYSACGACKYCRRGLENLCESAAFTGYSVNGGYAEYVVAKGDFVHPLPESFNDYQAAPLMCAGAIGYRALRLTNLLERGEGALGIFGLGSSGQLILKLAKALGLRVYVFTHSKWKVELAYRMGADWAGDTGSSPGVKLDAAIVLAPASWVFVEALKKVDRGGRVVVGEIYMTPIERLDYQLLWLEREVKTVANVTRRDVREFLEMASKYSVTPDVEIYELEDANRALIDLKHGRLAGQAVLRVK